MADKESRIKEEIDHLRQRIARLEAALEVLSEFEETKPEPTPKQETTDKPGATQAVRTLFENEPKRKWRPKEIAELLQDMMDQDQLKVKAGRKPLDFTHTILRELVKQEFITKHQPVRGSRRSYYIKTSDPP